MILNNTQQAVSDSAIDWYFNSPDMLFQIDGEAGTGKSVVLNDIVKRLGLEDENVLAMAFTGQAAIVMRTKGLKNACTIHSALFMPVLQDVVDPATGRVVINPKFNMPVTKWIFVPKYIDKKQVKLVIVDEAYMVPASLKAHIDRLGIKTIVAGDTGQLPPVKEEPAYLVSGKIHHLTELMRQAEDSALVYLAHRARHGYHIDCGRYGNDVLVMYDDEIIDDVFQRCGIVLCGKNKTRDSLNHHIRNNVFQRNTDYPMFGERVICRKNNWSKEIDGIALANGLTGSVVRPPSVSKFDGMTLNLDFKPDLLDQPFVDLDINYKYLNANYMDKDKIRNSPYESGDLLEYAYASTVHLSQGSEYPCGIYYEEFLYPTIQKNLNYTAITRFKNQMIYVKHKPKYWSTKN